MAFVTGNSTIIKESLLAKEVTRLLDKKFVIIPWANTMYEGEVKQQGDTVSIQTFPNISWSSGTTAGADITATTYTITKDQLVVDQLAQMRVEVTNIEEIQSNLALREEVANRMAYGQSDLLEKFVVSIAVPGVHASNKLGEVGTALTSATVYGAVEAMRVALSNQNAFNDAALFVRPSIASLIRQSSLFDGYREGLDTRKEGYIGKMSGFNIFETNNIGYPVMFSMDRNAVHFAAQWTGFKVTDAPNGFRKNVLGEVAFGGKVCTENTKRIAVYYCSNT